MPTIGVEVDVTRPAARVTQLAAIAARIAVVRRGARFQSGVILRDVLCDVRDYALTEAVRYRATVDEPCPLHVTLRYG